MKSTLIKTNDKIRNRVLLAQEAVAALANGQEEAAEKAFGILSKDLTGEDLFGALVYWDSFIKPLEDEQSDFVFVASVAAKGVEDEADLPIHDNAGTIITAIGNKDLDGANQFWQMLDHDEFLDTAIAILVLAADAYRWHVEPVEISAA